MPDNIWVDSVNEKCPFCGRDTKYCTDAVGGVR